MKRSKPRRLLYRTGFTPAELDQLIAEIGPDPLVAALDRWAVLRSTKSIPAE
jgi:hypothetical protein